MKKENLIAAGKAAYGEKWVTALSDDLKINRKTIQRYNSGELPPNPRLLPELLAVLEVRKAAIDSAASALKNDFYIDEKVDLTESFFVVSDGGRLLDERFDSLEKAEVWVRDNFDEDDLYLVKYHKMTIAEQFALETIQYYSDICDPSRVLQAIKSGQYSKTEQEYCLILCELDDNHLGREYYTYFIANEFNLGSPSFNSSDEPDCDFSKTMSYKDFILKRIAELSQYVAINF